MTRIPGEDDEEFHITDADDIEEAIDLTPLDDDYEAAPIASRTLPDGTYEVTVDRVELLRARSGKPMIKWTLLVDSSRFPGRRLWRHLVVSPENLPQLKADFETCSLRLDKLHDLPARLGDLHNLRLKVSKKRTRDGYENVFLLRRLPAA